MKSDGSTLKAMEGRAEAPVQAKRAPATCVKFSREEHERIQEDSKLSGKSGPELLKSAYFRMRRVVVLMSKEDQTNWLRELRAWGNNVNQLARRVNSGAAEDWYEEFKQVRDSIARIERFVVGVYGHR